MRTLVDDFNDLSRLDAPAGGSRGIRRKNRARGMRWPGCALIRISKAVNTKVGEAATKVCDPAT